LHIVAYSESSRFPTPALAARTAPAGRIAVTSSSVHTTQRFEISCLERDHALHKRQSIAGYENSLHEMIHPITQRMNVLDNA
jgi:hypothetical protein